MYLSKNKKSGIWFVYYRKENSARTRISCRTRIKREANQFLKDFEKKKKRSEEFTDISLGDFRDKYLEAIKVTHTIGSFKGYKTCIDKFVDHIGERVLLKNIKRINAESFILKTQEKSKTLASLEVRTLKAFFNRGIAWSMVEVNPFKGIKVRVPKNSPLFLTLEQLQLVLENEPMEYYRKIYIFQFYTGLRISESLNLDWSDINFETNEIKVTNKENFTTKSKKERVVPFRERVKEILHSFKVENSNQSHRVFDREGRTTSLSYISHRFKAAVRKAGLDGKLHLHSTRHSFASRLVQNGADLYSVKELLGHANITTTQIYSHLTKKNLREAVELLD